MTLSVVKTDQPLLERVARFADQLARSADMADQGSLDAAADMAALYEAREWVAEWLIEAPIKPKTAYIGGRPPQPDSKSRFEKWLRWRLEASGHHRIQARHTYQLLNAYEVRGYLRGAQITSEYVLRPLDWFRKHKLQRFIPDVWERAIELADGRRVTHEHTRAAVLEWKRANAGQVLVTIQSSRAERDRIKARDAVRVLISHADRAELVKFNNWVVDELDKVFAEMDASDA